MVCRVITDIPTPLLWHVAEFRAGEKGLLSGRGGGTWHVSPFPVEERNIYAITATYLVQIIL